MTRPPFLILVVFAPTYQNKIIFHRLFKSRLHQPPLEGRDAGEFSGCALFPFTFHQYLHTIKDIRRLCAHFQTRSPWKCLGRRGNMGFFFFSSLLSGGKSPVQMQLTNPALTADPDHVCVCACSTRSASTQASVEQQENHEDSLSSFNSQSEKLCADQIWGKSATGSDVMS